MEMLKSAAQFTAIKLNDRYRPNKVSWNHFVTKKKCVLVGSLLDEREGGCSSQRANQRVLLALR